MTTTQKVSRETIEYALFDAGFDEDSASVRSDYSGRAMYGSECFGIVFDNFGSAFQFFAVLCRKCGTGDVDGNAYEDLAEDLARVARTDSMGRSVIVYFPGYTLDGEDEVED